MKKIFASLFILLFLTVSCEKEAENAVYPEFVRKLVVSCYVTPGADCTLKLLFNSHLYGDVPLGPKQNLKISFSGHELIYDTISYGFPINTAEIPIIEGKTYTLNITGDKGLTASGSCTVPFSRNFHPEIDTVKVTNSYHYDDTEYTSTTVSAFLSFTDFRDEINYYSTFSNLIAYYPSGRSISNLNQPFSEYYNYFSDKGSEGKRVKISLGEAFYPDDADSIILKVYLMNIDKNYYEFRNSMKHYSSGENPLIEASPVYTNITGGLGIFASYTMDSVFFRIK